MSDITWLHLSDLHILSTSDDTYSLDKVLKALLETLKNGQEKPDLIFITGDIINRGRADYSKVKEFFDELLDASGLTGKLGEKEAKKRLFIVPGNHDVDRSKTEFLGRPLKNNNQSINFFNPKNLDKREAFFKRFHGYKKFFNNYFKGIRTFNVDNHYYSELLVLKDIAIGIIGLNSCWFAQGPNENDDEHKLWIGERTCDKAFNALDKQGKSDITIILYHHPIAWLHPEEIDNIKDALTSKADILLYGHLHKDDAEDVMERNDRRVLKFQAGSAYGDSAYPHRALWGCIDINTCSLTIRPIKYEEGYPGAWTPDTSLYKYNSQSNYTKTYTILSKKKHSDKVLNGKIYNKETPLIYSSPEELGRQAVDSLRDSWLCLKGEETRITPSQVMPSANIVRNASQISLSPRIIRRNELVKRFTFCLKLSSVLWLYGSSGVGKTIMAQFIIKQSKGDWWYVSLRDCSKAQQLNFHLGNVISSLDSSDLGGIILDDFPSTHANSARINLSILANEISSRNGQIIVIANKPPPPSIENCFGKDFHCIKKMPYLSQSEVAEMIKNSNGDPEKWARVIHTVCGMGHPQLVDARISGLSRRGWPQKELFDGIGGLGGSAIDIENELENVRNRLIEELPDETRKMLYRLTLVMGVFDRKLVSALGSIEPVISCPGEELDRLIGPWIEKIGTDRFRVSPLVRDAGDKNLNETVKSHIHQKITDHLLTRNPFPGEYLKTFLGHALISRHGRGLCWLTMTVLNMRDEDQKMLSECLFLLTSIDVGKDKPIFPENMFTSAMLRLAQFKVTVAAHETKELEFFAERLIAEARLIEPKGVNKYFLYIAIITVLAERALEIRPKKWLPLLLEVKENFDIDEIFSQSPSRFVFSKEKMKNVDILQLIFGIRCMALADMDDLSELFTVLDELKPEFRNYLLPSVQARYLDPRMMVQSAWLTEHRKSKESIDGVAAAEKYRKFAEIAEKWGNTDLVIECVCVRAIMLDEYAHDMESALNSLIEAEKKYPNHIRLTMQRHKVLYRSGDHMAALATIEPILNQISEQNRIDGAFTFREAGISAAKIGDLKKASQLFYKGYKSAIKLGDILLPMAAGLLADCAFCEFKASNYSTTVKYMLHALTEAEKINPEKGLKENFCIRILGQIIMCMRSQSMPQGLGFNGLQVVYGCCSNPEPHEDIIKMEILPKLLSWYQLAHLEADLRVNEGVLEQLRERTKLKKHLSSELTLNQAIMKRYIREKNINRFFAYLPEYVEKYVYFTENRKKLMATTLHTFEPMEFTVSASDDWSKLPYIEITKDVILGFSVSLLCSDNFDVNILVSNIDKITVLSKATSAFLECFEKQLFTTGDIHDVVASCIGMLAKRNSGMNPDDLFLSTFYLWNWLVNSNCKDIIGEIISEYLLRRWCNVIKNQGFLLKQPKINIPSINDAINSELKGTAKIAEIVLAAEAAVKHRLPENTRQSLKKSLKL